MSEDLVEKPFRDAAAKVEAAHNAAVEDAKAKVQNAKSSALKKVSS